MYTYDINIMTSNGGIHGISTGVLEGDPLGTFLFSWSLQPSLYHFCSYDPLKSNLYIFAYVDDIYLPHRFLVNGTVLEIVDVY